MQYATNVERIVFPAKLPGIKLAANIAHKNIAPIHGHEIIDVYGGAEHRSLLHGEGAFHIAQHHGRSAVRDERAIGSLERPGNQRVLVGNIAAVILTT